MDDMERDSQRDEEKTKCAMYNASIAKADVRKATNSAEDGTGVHIAVGSYQCGG